MLFRSPKIDGYALSAPDGIQFWADFNGCDPEAGFRLGTDPKIGIFSYNNCDDDARVTLYRVKDGGHEWPNVLFGGNIARFTWQLFKADANAKLPTAIGGSVERRSHDVYPRLNYGHLESRRHVGRNPAEERTRQ